MIDSSFVRHGRFAVSAAIAVLLLAGCATEQATVVNSPAPAPPSASATATATATAGVPTPDAATPPAAVPDALPEVLPRSEPVTLSLPSTGTTTDLMSLGLQDDGSLEVPPGEPGSPAGWYNQSPTPGERGPAVVLGHVNATDGGAGVFASLRDLGEGDTIKVTRKDGSVATFVVQRGEQYAKDEFPTIQVYGNTNGAELRLITCDGYDPETGLFDDNYVVYATLEVT
ncbi:peptidase C60 sortase A and B [Arthrobacter sp. Leaf234]|uniref:class F sortase n=1 Tax=Arthrobacter sp. Leaf234 TaxID=1736303 RepID=UPI0006F23396|nr:class F sortase [Arthrobacter sp. Leaf234]KQO01677.1 peptidase C60 sortase A and B [Arthrobacter sp. Leaf234]